MKVRICYTETFSNDFRRALAIRYGQDGLASRQEIINWRQTHGDQDDDDLMLEAEDILSAEKELIEESKHGPRLASN